MADEEDYHASVLILGPNNEIVLIIQDGRSFPLWKFAGGKKEAGETPEQTAVREAYEETGLIVETKTLQLIETRVSKSSTPTISQTHIKYFFVGHTNHLPEHLSKFRGNDWERPGVFKLEQIEKMVDIHPHYFKAYLKAKEAGLV